MLKVLLVRTQVEMRNMDPEGKVIFVIKWWKTWLNCVLGMWKVENVSEELRYLLRTFLSKVLEVWPGFSFLLIAKCNRGQINWEVVKQKEPEHEDLKKDLSLSI